jgi:hypothetical protein
LFDKLQKVVKWLKEKTEFPLVMKPADVAEVMGISKRTAYDVMEMPDFPLIRVRKTKLVSREAFFGWLERAGEVRR